MRRWGQRFSPEKEKSNASDPKEDNEAKSEEEHQGSQGSEANTKTIQEVEKEEGSSPDISRIQSKDDEDTRDGVVPISPLPKDPEHTRLDKDPEGQEHPAKKLEESIDLTILERHSAAFLQCFQDSIHVAISCETGFKALLKEAREGFKDGNASGPNPEEPTKFNETPVPSN
ncbi:hypothetical protein M9H77_35546 [Catharanthus roseus]|uniref:Uncharacterized protein n=1 Tax=Catharanthus roseus TaxID=4058 RepID=A0ACB9ZRV9_CATRO|nr:hypothetical protein M9H77_35546 [Catharanthus roseus]